MEAESPTKRDFTNEWNDKVWSSRLNDRSRDVKVYVQQRSHKNDVTGHLLKKNLKNLEVLILPARYEMENRIKTSLTGWKDLRTKKGEPLWPEHQGEEALKELEEDLVSPYIISGQLQQRPTPKEGGMFKRKKFKIISVQDFERLKLLQQVEKTVRYWDKAGTEDGGCNTAGVLMHKTKGGRYIISDSVKGQWSYSKRENRIKRVSIMDNDLYNKYTVWIEQEPGSAGLESADRTVKNLSGITCKKDKVSGSKIQRAQPYEAQVDIENIYLVEGDWNESFLEEHEVFPKGDFKDQVDSAAGAFSKLANNKRRAGVA